MIARSPAIRSNTTSAIHPHATVKTRTSVTWYRNRKRAGSEWRKRARNSSMRAYWLTSSRIRFDDRYPRRDGTKHLVPNCRRRRRNFVHRQAIAKKFDLGPHRRVGNASEIDGQHV